MNNYQRLHDLLAALDDKRLARLDLWDEEEMCGCAIGMILPHAVRSAGAYAVREQPGCVQWARPEVAKHLEALGFTPEFAWEIQLVNDDYGFRKESPEARYERVMKYLKEKGE